MSTADVEDLLAERGIVVSRETVRFWANRFGQHFAKCIRRDRSFVNDKWHLDEVVITIRGKKYWLWRAIDANGDVLDILLQNKHKTKPKRKSWRKLHLGLDLITGDIVCSDLTRDDVGDPTRGLLTDRFGINVEIIIPPPKTAILRPDAVVNPTLHDTHITAIATGGRVAWQVSSGYNQRSRGKAQMGRWKMVIGPKLKARSFPNQRTEAKIGAHILNKMTELGRAKFEAAA